MDSEEEWRALQRSKKREPLAVYDPPSLRGGLAVSAVFFACIAAIGLFAMTFPGIAAVLMAICFWVAVGITMAIFLFFTWIYTSVWWDRRVLEKRAYHYVLTQMRDDPDFLFEDATYTEMATWLNKKEADRRWVARLCAADEETLYGPEQDSEGTQGPEPDA